MIRAGAILASAGDELLPFDRWVIVLNAEALAAWQEQLAQKWAAAAAARREHLTRKWAAIAVSKAPVLVEYAVGTVEPPQSAVESDHAEVDPGADENGDRPKLGRPPKKDAWEIVDRLVRGKTFDGASACARKVYGDLRKHHDREKREGREFDLPAEGTVRNHVYDNAEQLGITWKSQ